MKLPWQAVQFLYSYIFLKWILFYLWIFSQGLIRRIFVLKIALKIKLIFKNRPKKICKFEILQA